MNKPQLKILICLLYYLPHRTGMQLYIQRVAEELVHRGHHVTILCAQHKSELPNDETINGVRVVRLRVRIPISRGMVMPAYPWAAFKLMREHDVVSIHTPMLETGLLSVIGGLTGRKIIVDTYGGWARHGGGAFSGKDPSKVDRSAAYAGRHVAKNVVAAGLADKCEVQVAYAIGVAKPVSLMVNTFGTGKISDDRIVALIRAHFDLRPKAIIQTLDLLRPIYAKTAAYGHFGRDEPEFTWENTDKAAALRADAGL